MNILVARADHSYDICQSQVMYGWEKEKNPHAPDRGNQPADLQQHLSHFLGKVLNPD